MTACYSQDKLPLPALFSDVDVETAESPSKAVKAVDQESHNAYLDKITADPAAIKSTVGDYGDADLRAELVEIRNALNYLYLTRLDESRVREIVVEELAKVNVRYADTNGHVRTQNVSIGSNYSGQIRLLPGEKLISYTDPITGQLVRVSDIQASVGSVVGQSRPVTRYSTPTASVFIDQGSASQPIRAAIQVPRGPMRTLLRGVSSTRRPTTSQNFYYRSSNTSVCVGPNCP